MAGRRPQQDAAGDITVDGDVLFEGGSLTAALAGKVTLPALALPLVASNYYSPAAAAGVAIPSEAVELAYPFLAGRTCTIDRIGVLVTVVGSAGAVIRLGIRGWDTANSRPGTLLTDGGTVNCESSTGWKEATVSQAVTAGVMYAVTATVQGAAVTPPTVTIIDDRPPFTHLVPMLSGSEVQFNFTQWSKSSVTGALNNTGSFARQALSTPRIGVRAS